MWPRAPLLRTGSHAIPRRQAIRGILVRVFDSSDEDAAEVVASGRSQRDSFGAALLAARPGRWDVPFGRTHRVAVGHRRSGQVRLGRRPRHQRLAKNWKCSAGSTSLSEASTIPVGPISNNSNVTSCSSCCTRSGITCVAQQYRGGKRRLAPAQEEEFADAYARRNYTNDFTSLDAAAGWCRLHNPPVQWTEPVGKLFVVREPAATPLSKPHAIAFTIGHTRLTLDAVCV